MADIFVKLQDVDGESQEFEAAIEADHFNFGVSNPVDWSGGGSAAGRAHVMPFNMVMKTGRHTTKLLESVCAGVAFPSGEIFFTQQIGDAQAAPEDRKYFSVQLQHVFVENWSVSKGEDQRPLEQITLNAKIWKLEYKVADEGQALTATAPVEFDMQQNAILS